MLRIDKNIVSPIRLKEYIESFFDKIISIDRYVRIVTSPMLYTDVVCYLRSVISTEKEEAIRLIRKYRKMKDISILKPMNSFIFSKVLIPHECLLIFHNFIKKCHTFDCEFFLKPSYCWRLL